MTQVKNEIGLFYGEIREKEEKNTQDVFGETIKVEKFTQKQKNGTKMKLLAAQNTAAKTEST